MSVSLRPVEEKDLEHFFRHQQDGEAIRMAAFTHADPSDREAFDEHWLKVRNNPDVTLRTILADQQVVGHIASFVMEGQREVTYWIDRGHWGRGIASEALKQFLEVEQTIPLFARVAKDNLGSKRVLEKCGFMVYGEDKGFAHGRGCDTEEWLLKLDPSTHVQMLF